MIQVYWRNEISEESESSKNLHKLSVYKDFIVRYSYCGDLYSMIVPALQDKMQESCNQNRNARNMQYCLPSPYLNMILFSSAVGIVMDFLAKQRVFSWVFPGGTGPPPAWK